MSEVSRGLEEAVQVIIDNRPAEGEVRTRRQRHTVDVAFARIMALIAPRVRFFTKQYGLVAHAEDAEQACAIAVHRAIESYDPDKATFTTFVNWQIKGELQSLRFRILAEKRPSARKVGASLTSLHMPISDGEGEGATLEALIVDEDALEHAESGASDFLAVGMRETVIENYIAHLKQTQLETLKRRERNRRRERGETLSPAEMVARLDDPYRGIAHDDLAKLHAELEAHRQIVEQRLFDGEPLSEVCATTGESKDRVRRIARDAAQYLESMTEEHAYWPSVAA